MKEFLVKNKVVLILSAIGLVGGYFFVFKNRKPNLKIDNNVDWNKKIVNVKFGSNKVDIPYSTGILSAGNTYSDLYKLYYTVSGNKVIFEVKDKNNNVLEKNVVDFTSKIIY